MHRKITYEHFNNPKIVSSLLWTELFGNLHYVFLGKSDLLLKYVSGIHLSIERQTTDSGCTVTDLKIN